MKEFHLEIADGKLRNKNNSGVIPTLPSRRRQIRSPLPPKAPVGCDRGCIENKKMDCVVFSPSSFWLNLSYKTRDNSLTFWNGHPMKLKSFWVGPRHSEQVSHVTNSSSYLTHPHSVTIEVYHTFAMFYVARFSNLKNFKLSFPTFWC